MVGLPLKRGFRGLARQFNAVQSAASTVNLKPACSKAKGILPIAE